MLSLNNTIKFNYTFFILILIFIFSTKSHAQFHLFAGANAGYAMNLTENQIFDIYNSQENIQSEFKNINSFAGLTIGMQYKFDILAASLYYNTQHQDKRGYVSIYDNPYTPTKVDIFHKLIGYGVGLDAWFCDYLAIGTGFEYLKYGIHTKGPNDYKAKLANEFNWVNEFRLSIKFEASDVLYINLQPYYKYSLDSFDISGLNDFLFHDFHHSEFPSETHINQLGLRLLICQR